MKPVLILQHLNGDGPSYLRSWLRREGVPHVLFNSEAGQDFPAHIGDHAALAILGGEMGANDPLPSLRRAERLILEAMDAGRPVIGHCLGGQLMARALGARVGNSHAPEIGWHRVRLRAEQGAEAWFGNALPSRVFQWHYDAFELPAGASWLAESDACACQAFSIGPHLAMQFHVELDAPKLRAWAAAHDPRLFAAADAPTVQSAAAMLDRAVERLAAQQRLADRLYARWLAPAAH